MAYDVVLLPGDGIGPEVMGEARLVLEELAARLGSDFALTIIPCGGAYYLENGRDWPEGSVERCRAADLILLGAVGLPAPDGCGQITMPDGKMAGWSAVIGNRIGLDLYANIRPVRLFPGVEHTIHGRHRLVWSPANVDMVFVRENTEGLYSGIGEYVEDRGIATDVRTITRVASERIVRRAFELARRREHGAPSDGKRRVTCISKENVLRGCQLFVATFARVGAEYPDIEKDYSLVDAFTQSLMTQPERYDVCVTTNMFGDIVTDLAAVLQGGLGLAVGCNIGDEHAMFEPVHGSAPALAGKQRANPMAMILAVAEGLRWLGEKQHDSALARGAQAVDQAVAAVIREGRTLTFDLVGDERARTTAEVGEAVRGEMRRKLG